MKCLVPTLFFIILLPLSALADTSDPAQGPRFILQFGKGNSSQASYKLLSDEGAFAVKQLVEEIYEEYARIFSSSPDEKVVLRFLTPREYRRQTGAPSWTSAVYYRGQITLPLVKHNTYRSRRLERSLRHEYAHAFISDLSEHRCPPWLDEGLSQYLEGRINPSAKKAFQKWLRDNKPLAISDLNRALSSADKSTAASAYAESFYATRALVRKYGLPKIRDYLGRLGAGESAEQAFLNSFGTSEIAFQEMLFRQISRGL